MTKLIDLSGQRFTRLVVKSRIEGTYPVRWVCQCDCGMSAEVVGDRLKRGYTKSCGCLRRERVTVHGQSSGHTPEYSAWCNMKARCYNKNLPKYGNHGGRGITVCERWLNSFQNFYDDMGLKPAADHSIDRIDNNGNYEPGNCRWATDKEQANNRRNTVLHKCGGVSHTIKDWAEVVGIERRTLAYRINVAGWPIEMALNKPPQ